MGVVPGLTHDCFISYRRVDDVGLDNVQGHGWVSQFFRAFSAKLGECLGQSPDIFMDTQLEGNSELPPTLRDTARASAILVPIVSPGYQQSKWCPGEFTSFREQAESSRRWSIGTTIAVMKTVIRPLDGDIHLTLPVDDLGYWFFEIDSQTKIARRYELGSGDYLARIEKIALETAHFLAKLKALQSPTGSDPAGSPASHKEKELLLACDASEFTNTEGVKLVSCVETDEPDELSRQMDRVKATIALDPGFASNIVSINRIKRIGLRYEEDEAPLRDRVTRELAVMPWDGYISFAD